MTRQITSDWAWQEVQEHLTESRAVVYAILATQGPKTAGEITSMLPRRGNASWHRRLQELEAQGVVRRHRIRPCSVSNKSAWEWIIVYGAKPTKYKPKKKSDEIKAMLSTSLAHSSCACLSCNSARLFVGGNK